MQEDEKAGDFSPQEKVLVDYYLNPPKGLTSNLLSYDGLFALGALVVFGLGIWKEDLTMALIGFLLLFGRMMHVALASAHYSKLYHSIITKYEAKVNSLANRQESE